MTDAQWLSAIARYSSDEMRAIHRGELVGGAYELAHLLEAHVKKVGKKAITRGGVGHHRMVCD
jgi:hypothetical protein